MFQGGCRASWKSVCVHRHFWVYYEPFVYYVWGLHLINFFFLNCDLKLDLEIRMKKNDEKNEMVISGN